MRFADAPMRGGPYQTDVSLPALLESVWVYARTLGNGHVLGALALAGICVTHVVTRNRAILFAMAAAIAVLAAVLPLTIHRDPLHLYAPHFFAAISIAALGFGKPGSVLAALLATVIIASPPGRCDAVVRLHACIRRRAEIEPAGVYSPNAAATNGGSVNAPWWMSAL
ncbi:MAG: hypothetical protein ABIO38_08990 [Luteimonas sp.]